MANRPLSRRQVLRLGLAGSLLLGGAGVLGGLAGWADRPAAPGFTILRADELPMLRRIGALVLAGSAGATASLDATLQALDDSLAHLSPALLGQVRQLFGLLALPATRGPATGIWGRWDQASDAQVLAFLERWRTSDFDLLRQGHATLLQLLLMAWYGRAEAWAHCGYPGPPTLGT